MRSERRTEARTLALAACGDVPVVRETILPQADESIIFDFYSDTEGLVEVARVRVGADDETEIL